MTARKRNESLNEILTLITPGKKLRQAVDRIREAQLGALIILSNPEDIKDIMEGGFRFETDFTPQKVYELSKMDGGIIISPDCKKIYAANVELRPTTILDSDESGTRHRTAHRLAMQTGKIVITVSERRNKITVYKDDIKYNVESIADLLIKSSQAIMSLEKYSNIINKYLNDLNYFEFEDLVSLEDIIIGIRYFYLLFNMDNRIRKYILELGVEGKMLELQYKEIMLGFKNLFINFVKDYIPIELEKTIKAEKIYEKITTIEDDNFTDDNNIARMLGYDMKKYVLEDNISPRGYRLLGSVDKLSKKDIESIISKFDSIEQIFESSEQELMKIKGINKTKAYQIGKVCDKFKNMLELRNI